MAEQRNRKRIRSRLPPATRDLALQRLIPSMLTLAGTCAGLTAVVSAWNDRWDIAMAWIILAAFCDLFDGYTARRLNAESSFGVELDSLSDVIAFGAAPALMTMFWLGEEFSRISWLTCLIYVTCCMLRLARFNVLASTPKPAAPHSPVATGAFFQGVPAPAAAGCVLLPIYLDHALRLYLNLDAREAFPLLFATIGTLWPVIIAALMVSTVPTLGTKAMRIPRERVLIVLITFAALLTLLFIRPWIALSTMAVAYLTVLIPCSVARYRRIVHASPGRTPGDGTATADVSSVVPFPADDRQPAGGRHAD